MITLQMMKGTGPYNQMQRYIADVHEDLTPQQRAGKFTALLKCFVLNQNNCQPARQEVVFLRGSFVWAKTPEGYEFWDKINTYPEKPMEKQPRVKHIVAEQPKPAAPALVWPKGFYIYVNVGGYGRFINEEGQMCNGVFSKWANPQNFHNWQQKHPTYKRPETPLPNGLQWEEGYTHWTPGNAGRQFQFNDEGLFHPVKQKFEKWNPGFHEMHLKNCIARYPDNQPLILDIPPQAPVRPVGRRGDQPVPRVPEMENVVVEAPPAPKKQEQVVKKPIGWWK